MAFTDRLKGIFNYFEMDDSSDFEEQEDDYRMEYNDRKMRVAPAPIQPEGNHPVETRRSVARPVETKSNLQRLNDRQQELMTETEVKKTTIDIKFPKKYEEAPEIVNLLLGNTSVLIDFQFMSETQARRCLDYLDGARSVLSGSLKKVSNTMWLLTPVNVTVNIEELRSTGPTSDSQFDYDMRR